MIALVGLGLLGSRVCKQLPPDIPVLLVDYDTVEQENLHRQYPQEGLGMRKVDAAKTLFARHAQIVHKHIDVTTVGLLAEATLVIDCTDNLLVRYTINDFCSREGIPWIHSAMNDHVGTVAVFLPEGPCFQCLYPKGAGEACTRAANTALADKVASVVVQEAKLLLAGQEASHFIRVTANDKVVLALAKNKHCLACNGIYQYLDLKSDAFYITYCQNSNCMAAKPHRHSHDHGTPQHRTVQGIPLQVFPNGEIHFLKHADEDLLYRIAREVYEQK
jgi:molybdopterin-synthase adenylyltransferase